MAKKTSSIGIPESAKVIRGVAYVPLTDEFHQDEPLAFLVKCYDDTVYEYKVFANQRQAEDFAAEQNGEYEDWQVFPLYASHPN